jgi:hypothetical protein
MEKWDYLFLWADKAYVNQKEAEFSPGKIKAKQENKQYITFLFCYMRNKLYRDYLLVSQ